MLHSHGVRQTVYSMLDIISVAESRTVKIGENTVNGKHLMLPSALPHGEKMGADN